MASIKQAAEFLSPYAHVCTAKTKKEMAQRFNQLLAACVKKYGGTKAKHRKQQLANVGYFAGYYDVETQSRVFRSSTPN